MDVNATPIDVIANRFEVLWRPHYGNPCGMFIEQTSDTYSSYNAENVSGNKAWLNEQSDPRALLLVGPT